MITIDGISYDVPVVSVDETCDFLDKYAERTEDGKLKRELIGCYFNQKIVFGTPTSSTQVAAYTSLWEKLTEPVEFHEVSVPDTDGVDFEFTAYFSNVTRSLKKWKDGMTRWKSITVNFTAQDPARVP